MAVREKPKVAELRESAGEDVDEEAAYELMSIESHGSLAVVVFVVLPLKSHLTVLEG